MADQKTPKDSGAAPKGAVEVDEEKLDDAEGGISFSYSKVDYNYLGKPAASEDPTIGQATSSPEKKI